MSIKVLCVVDYFLPGYLGGGPVTSIYNMRNQLRGLVEFSIYTRDRDLGSASSYKDVLQNEWSIVDGEELYYSTPAGFGCTSFFHAINSHYYEIIYINSFFSFRGSILPLIIIRLLDAKIPVILAPRGEFSPGALKLKNIKKKIFLFLARLFQMHSRVFWHASTELEKFDIQNTCHGIGRNIFIAADPVVVDLNIEYPQPEKSTNSLRMAFISRLSPKKNLIGLLRALSQLTSDVILDIFGPIEDAQYWIECEDLIKNIRNNIKVNYCGTLRPDEVSITFARYNLFAFPTYGENFGHVIFEALRAGTPVLVSDQTPWQQDDAGAITVIPLNNLSGWIDALEMAASYTAQKHQEIRRAALEYANRYAHESRTKTSNYELFSKSLN